MGLIKLLSVLLFCVGVNTDDDDDDDDDNWFEERKKGKEISDEVEVEDNADDIGAVEWIWVIDCDCRCDTDNEDDDDIEVGRSFFI